jgi:NAD(P)-dependent dehydrogenase (short-subunit alcohol dehydrogenase family)
MVDMTGKVALVTGGSSGIGRAAALRFAGAGARVVVADVNLQGGQDVVDEIERQGGRVLFVATDVTSPEACEAMVASTVSEFGGLDYAMNNAGMSGQPGGILACPIEQWNQTLTVNLTSMFLCMKFEVPALAERGGGAIVNTASGAGLIGFPALPAYVASKHGVVGLTKSVALELVQQGIRVNCVCPGTTRTAMIDQTIAAAPELESVLDASSPIGRMAAPDEIAAAAVWLCSDEASFVTGVAFPVDAGAVAG